MRRVDKRFCLSGQVLDTHQCMVAQKEMVLFVQMGANGLELLITKRLPQPILEPWLPNLPSETKTYLA
jgi:hypothetical protein